LWQWNEIAGVSVTGVIIGLVELAKRAGLNPRYGGHLAWLLGVLIVMGHGILGGSEYNLIELFLLGSALGLSASGLYGIGKIHYENYKNWKKKN
jgi:hypothetical protein